MSVQPELPIDLPHVDTGFLQADAAETARKGDMYRIAEAKRIAGGWAFLGDDKNMITCIVEVYACGETHKYTNTPAMVMARWQNT